MNKETIISKTSGFVRETLYGEGTGHDWWHVWRVRNIACIFNFTKGHGNSHHLVQFPEHFV